MISFNTGLREIDKLLFSPDGTCLAVTQRAGGTHLLNAQTFESIARYRHNGPIAFSPDSQILAIADSSSIAVHRHGEPPLVLEKSDGSWDDIRFTPYDQHLEASSHHSRGFARWDAVSGRLVYESYPEWRFKAEGYEDRGARIEGFTYSLSNGHRITLISSKELARKDVWEAISSNESIEQRRIRLEAILSNGSKEQRRIRLEAILSNGSKEQRRIRIDNKGVMPYPPLISSDGCRMATRWVLAVGIWNLETLNPVARISLGSKPFVGAAITPDGRQLMAIVNTDRCVRFWSLEDGAPGETFDWNIGYPTAVAVAPDGLRYAVANAKGQVVIWDAA